MYLNQYIPNIFCSSQPQSIHHCKNFHITTKTELSGWKKGGGGGCVLPSKWCLHLDTVQRTTTLFKWYHFNSMLKWRVWECKKLWDMMQKCLSGIWVSELPVADSEHHHQSPHLGIAHAYLNLTVGQPQSHQTRLGQNLTLESQTRLS